MDYVAMGKFTYAQIDKILKDAGFSHFTPDTNTIVYKPSGSVRYMYLNNGFIPVANLMNKIVLYNIENPVMYVYFYRKKGWAFLGEDIQYNEVINPDIEVSVADIFSLIMS